MIVVGRATNNGKKKAALKRATVHEKVTPREIYW
jgi:hypothetical protein